MQKMADKESELYQHNLKVLNTLDIGDLVEFEGDVLNHWGVYVEWVKRRYLGLKPPRKLEIGRRGSSFLGSSGSSMLQDTASSAKGFVWKQRFFSVADKKRAKKNNFLDCNHHPADKGLHDAFLIVHNRLAVRNILLTSDGEVKVAGFGPQNKEGDDEAKKNERIPAKLVAPEVLLKKPSTEKSDVWSYGVVLWEIFSMGEVPYPGLHSTDIGTRLKEGYRMEKPCLADDIHYQMMSDCWQYKPNKRPTFHSLRSSLSHQFSPGGVSCGLYYESSQLTQ